MENELLEVDNLKKFGSEFQSKCIAILITDKVFLERIYDILSPNYFETDAHKWIINLVMEYFSKYRDTPTLEVFKVELEKITDEVVKAAVFQKIKAAYNQVSAADKAYVKEQFLEFSKNQTLRSAILKSADLLRRSDYEGVWKVINDASKAGAERKIGHDYFQEFEERMSESARETIPTSWPLINVHLDGGLGKGELGFIVAPAGSGKSWFLAKIGSEAMQSGKNVMHFTMELNEKYVGRRYDACFSGVAFQEVRNSKETIREAISNIPGKLFIQYFPMHTASAFTLKSHMERVQLITGVKIDMVIVDYADLLRPFTTNKNTSLYEEGGSIYSELRTMAGELQLPTWSASQANRGAHEEEVVGALNVADSYKKIMIGDFIMSLARNTEDKIAGTGRISILKSRFGSDGSMYPCRFDTSCGKVEVFDKSSIEGAEILAKAKDSTEVVKDAFRKRWREHHDNP